MIKKIFCCFLYCFYFKFKKRWVKYLQLNNNMFYLLKKTSKSIIFLFSLFAPKCAKCKLGLVKGDLMMSVRNKKYHVQCFRLVYLFRYYSVLKLITYILSTLPIHHHNKNNNFTRIKNVLEQSCLKTILVYLLNLVHINIVHANQHVWLVKLK